MTGGAFFASAPADEYDLDSERHAVQWVGTPGVKGPKWARLPLLTVGMLGIQCVWSIEMGYASPYLLELGLSKSWMSLVFMAGPLSGLIVQPLIGAYADRSRSRFGRRRPFMVAGTAVCVFAMMLLGWTREVATFFGAGSWLAIALAVWAIYLIDFSINAVMSTDRALIVDTLPPSQQEDGSAWAGRMSGIGGVAGFFVGNIDLESIVPFLGKTQLQILSVLTSTLLTMAHTFTSWAVNERVLLRDDRPQSRAGLISSLRAIWDNMFTLPPGIRTVCFIQFFANLGWYPILFFTSIWISEIYKQTHPQGDLDDETWEADAVRAGSRALFLQALVTIVTSVGAPFLVEESGVQPSHQRDHAYAALGGAGEVVDDGADEGDHELPHSAALWKPEGVERYTLASFGHRAAASLATAIKSVKSGSAWTLPIKGLTLIRLWCLAQFIFVATMAASWFTKTVTGAYILIAITGFSWSLAQWAPYALLGELVLIDTSPERAQLQLLHQSQDNSHQAAEFELDHVSAHTSPRSSEVHSRSASARVSRASTPAAAPPPELLGPNGISLTGPDDDDDNVGHTVVIRHSDDLSVASDFPERVPSPSQTSPPDLPSAKSTADKAGLILGIHNVFIVMPQFVITGLSSLIFYLMEPASRSGVPSPSPLPDAGVINGTIGGDLPDITARALTASLVVVRDAIVNGSGSSPDAVGLIFRIGGISAAVGGIISIRLGRDWARGRGI